MPVSICSIAGSALPRGEAPASAAIWPRSLSTGIRRARWRTRPARRREPVQDGDLAPRGSARAQRDALVERRDEKRPAAGARRAPARPRRAEPIGIGLDHRGAALGRRRRCRRAAANWRRSRRDRSRGSTAPARRGRGPTAVTTAASPFGGRYGTPPRLPKGRLGSGSVRTCPPAGDRRRRNCRTWSSRRRSAASPCRSGRGAAWR